MGRIVESEILHLTRFGEIARPGDDTPGPVGPSLALNSPVGICLDRRGNVWVCDTGNNRVLVFDAGLSELRHVFYAPAEGKKGAGGVPFRMPFHVCPHPDRNRVFITDMGNSRVVVMDCDTETPRFACTIGDKAKGAFTPLQDPNGITLVRQKDGSHHVFVNDEFFHNASEPLRNRCVRFDEQGNYISEFRSIVVNGQRHDLYWPQGLSSDAEGNLYIANTGSYEILRCASDAVIDSDFVVHQGRAVVAHRHGQPRGLGMLNIMRDVNVIGERVFVPDHVANAISVYHTDGRPLATVSGVRAGWHHGLEPMRSATDPLYYLLEDSALVSPYVICDGGEPDVYFISEPFTSRILKVRIEFNDLDGDKQESVVMLAAVGGRRDGRTKSRTAIGQFNCVTSVISLPATQAQLLERSEWPAAVSASSWLQWPVAASAALAGQYDFWWGGVARNLLEKSGAAEQLQSTRITLDAGNWRLTGCRADGEDYVAASVRVDGWFLAGNLGMAVFTPDFPLLGQVVPGSPILLVGNFNMGTIGMYQVGPLGSLINYGVPFGMHGTAPGCIAGPQGMAASADGRVYIADTLNNRMSLWQILPSGTASFVRNFVWHGHERGDQGVAPFTPTDAVLAGNGHLYVTDQFNNRICVFDHDGKPLFAFGKQGYWEEGEPDGERFMLPTSLAIDGERLIVNDLVNRALKVFTLGDGVPRFDSGISLFKRTTEEGGVWMPFFMHAHEGRVYVADSTYNIVQVYCCQAA